jgi:hypothetical protein
MAKSWDSVEVVFSPEDRKRNAYEREVNVMVELG